MDGLPRLPGYTPISQGLFHKGGLGGGGWAVAVVVVLVVVVV